MAQHPYWTPLAAATYVIITLLPWRQLRMSPVPGRSAGAFIPFSLFRPQRGQLPAWLNYRGLNAVGIASVWLALFCLTPFLAIIVLGLPHIKPSVWVFDWQVRTFLRRIQASVGRCSAHCSRIFVPFEHICKNAFFPKKMLILVLFCAFFCEFPIFCLFLPILNIFLDF